MPQTEERTNERDDWTLVAFTLLVPTSFFTYLMSLALPLDLDFARPAARSLSWALVTVALLIMPLHVGRPARALRVVTNLRHSWLAREMTMTILYALLLTLHAFEPLVPSNLIVKLSIAGATLLSGALGLWAGVRSYTLATRPGWPFGLTLAEFLGAGLTNSLVLMLALLTQAMRELESLVLILERWLRWGSVGVAIWIILAWAFVFRRTVSYATGSDLLPGHPTPAQVWKLYRVGSYALGAGLIFLAVAALYHPDMLLLLAALIAEASAGWFYRLAFFARGRPVNVVRLAARERQMRLGAATGDGHKAGRPSAHFG